MAAVDMRRIISPSSINRLSNKIRAELFGNNNWKFDYKSMITLLDKISNDQRAPNPQNMPTPSSNW